LKGRRRLRIVLADDERPARSFLVSLLQSFPDVDLLGEAASGTEAIALIETHRPDLALLDLQMPEVDGLGVVRLLRKGARPQIAFVTAYDEYAVQAFELNAIDYLLKPVERPRLERTLERVHDRLEQLEGRESEDERLERVAQQLASASRVGYLERIPIRQREEILILPVERIASIVAETELLVVTTVENQRYYLTHRLKELEGRLDPTQFVRLNRGVLVRIDQIDRLSPLPGGTYLATLHNRQELQVSRTHARLLREQWLRI
jgi:two-component system LytT family response regulator